MVDGCSLQDNVGVAANLCHHHAHVEDVCGDASHSSMLIGRVVSGCSLQDNVGVAANLCHHHAHVQDVCGECLPLINADWASGEWMQPSR